MIMRYHTGIFLNTMPIMKNQITLLFFLLLSTGVSLAQQLVPFVVSSSGGFYNNASGMLSFTTGEMAAVETFTSASNILTQGFQQSWDFGTYISEHPNPDFSFCAYPNPSDGYFSALTESEENVHLALKISDVLGRDILHTEFYQQDKIHVHPIDLSNTAPGMYLITVIVKEHQTNSEFQFVEKIQIIR